MSSTVSPTTTPSPGSPGGPGSFGEVFFITLAVTLVACIWILYLAFYNARVFGFLLTKVINKFIKQGHLHVGSFSFSVLSGKVMFYDVAYITEDSTIRAQHGLLIFRWWRPYTPLGGQEDTSQCETRLTVFLSSCEVHFYNRTSLYAQLEEAFGLPSQMSSSRERDRDERESTGNDGKNELQRRHEAAGISWRDFFGVIKFEVTDGRFVFGNKLLPSVLVMNIEDCHGIYTTREPECRWDQFTHEVKCTAEGLRVVLAPSPKYEGPMDEPPRYMGDGFAVMQSSKVQIHYYQDEPGIVPTPEELLENEEDEQPSKPPVSVLDITCQKKGTHFTYGPWADRQREFLMKFFYPQQYKTHPATPPAVPGDKRQFEKLDITLNIVEEATIDILFTKNKETNAFHIDMKRGSYIEISIPQIVGIEGYNTKIIGQLLILDADTSLPYRSFIKSETLEFKVDVHYPRAWNHPQNWEVSLTFSKADWFFIYAHKVFLTDLMSDWSSKGRQDLFNFVPYTVRLNITLHQFELLLPVNEYNWVDCSSHHEENVCIGLVGEQLEMSIVLPFADYLPQSVPIRILIKADAVCGYLFLPDCYTGQHLFTALDKSAKASCSYLENKKSMGLDRNYWRHKTDDPNWIECACVPVVALCILYTYHPTPLDEDVPRIVVKQGPRGKQQWSSVPPQTSYGGWRRGESMVDPGALSADSLQLEVDIGPLLVMTYGPLIKMIPSLKEDFLGLNQDMVDFSSPLNKKDRKEEPTKYDDSRILNPMALRPFNITVSLNIDGIKGFLPKYCSKSDVGCATLVMEQLCFEMCREFTQTKLQLLLSPILLMVPNSPTQVAIPPSNQPERGQMALSGLQLRCHAMFSRAGIPPDSETVEYAWLIDLQMGALSGQLTVPQLLAIVDSLSLTIPLVVDPVDKLSKPARPQMCVHMVDSERCAAREGGIYPSPCPSEDDLKYRVVRVAVNAVQLQLVENTTALEIKVNQIRLATCNLHSDTVESGLTALINHIDIHQYLLQSDHPSFRASSQRPLRSEPLQNWLEVGAINLGPVCVDCVGFLQSVSDYRMQHYFLMMHDDKTKRLWFLWPPDSLDRVYLSSVKCGCQGGCVFFSDKPYGTHFFKANNGTHSQRSSWNDEFQQKESDYGRSLLQEGKWVFSVCDRTPADSPTKAFKFTPGWVGLASPTSPGDQFWPNGANEEKNKDGSEEPAETKKEPSQSESSQQSSTTGILRKESQRSQQSHASQQSDSAGSAVRSSICSEPTSHQQCDSSSTISSNTAPVEAQLVGSSHSLPVDTQQVQGEVPLPPSRNNSAETMPKAGRAMHFEQYPPGLDRTRASSIDSPTSGADSEYFSAGEDPALASALQTSTSSASIPSTVHPPTDSGSSVSEFKLQSTISSSDHHSPEVLESATSTESFVSAASSEDTLIRMRDEKDHGTVKRKDQEHHSPYSPFLTRVTSHRWSVPLSLESWKQYVNFDPADMTPSSSMYQASIQMMGFVKQQQGVSPEIITAVDSDVTSSDSEGVSDQSSVRHASDHMDASLQDLHERLFAEPSHTTTVKLEPSSGTSVFAEIQGPVNVLMTPLLLVAINRYVDAAKPITTGQHPAALLSSLHHSCIADVESLFLRGLLPEGGSSASLSRQQQLASANFNNNADSEEREDGTKTVTMTVKLPKVNLCVLQVPEDGVGVPNLTSNNASLLIAQLGSSEANLWIKQIDRSIKVETQNQKRAPQDTQAAVAMGAVEQSDPTVVTLIKFFKLHAQLRRLARPRIKTIESPTAIPEQYTQVQFTLASKVPTSTSTDDSDSRYASLPRKRRLSVHMPKSWIMAESGMEEISIKLGRQGGDIPLPKIKLAGDGSKKASSDKKTDKKEAGSSKKKRTDSSSSAKEGSGKRKKRDRFSSSGGSGVEKPSDTKERGLDFCIHISSFWSHLPTPPQPKKESFVQGSDTNLLTTASPALDEWLRAMTGLTTSVGDIIDARHFRSCALMACIMAEAHDDLENHQPLPKKKQTKWAAISDAMLQDLSCQLMSILWRYLSSADWQKIEEIVSGEDLPALSSLESGTNTLIRQWKVTLSLINPQVNVARFPQQVAVYKSPEERGLKMEDEMWTPRQISEDPTSDVPASAGHTGDSELMDPLTLSLYSDRIGVGLQKSIYAEFSGKVDPHRADWLRELSSANRHRDKSGDSATRYRSMTNTSTAGSASGTSAKKSRGGYKALDEEDKHDPFSPSSSMGSDDMTDDLDKSTPHLIDDVDFKDTVPVGSVDIDLESGSVYHIPGVLPEQKSPVVTPTVTQFGDADTLFRPLLTNLGLHKKKSSQPLAKLIQSVGQVSFQFKLDQFRVVITKSSSKHLRRHPESTRAPRAADTPAFLCEKIHVRAMVRETIPSEKSESLFKATSTTFFSGSSSIEICCDIHVGYIVQVINMAILRLLSQVIQMVENFQHAKTDLKLKQYVSSMPQGEGSVADLRTRASQSSHTRNPSHHSKTMFTPTGTGPLGRTRQSSQHSRSLKFAKEHETASLYSTAESFDSHADSDSIPKCWQTMYHLINLYSGVNEPVNVATTHVFVNPLFSAKGAERSGGVMEGSPDLGLGMHQDRDALGLGALDDLDYKETNGEEVPRPDIEGLEVSLIGTILVDEVCLLAQLAGLHLEADTTYITGSFSLQQTLPMQGYVPAALWRKFPSIGASLQTTAVTLELSEKAKKDFFTIASLTIDKPQSTVSLSGSLDHQNEVSLATGVDMINLTVPMNLSLLSAVVSRSSKKLAQRIQQLKQTQKSYRSTQEEVLIASAPSKPSLSGSKMDETWPPDRAEARWTLNGVTRVKTVVLQASVLPQLQAQYTIDGTSGTASWGEEGTFAADVTEHSFKFISTVPAAEFGAPAKISFPGIHFKGRYGQYDAQNESSSTTTTTASSRQGSNNILEAVTEIQAFQHTLSPDLVNHLITVQKVILKELNNMVRGIQQTHWPVSEASKTKLPASTPTAERLTYSMQVRLEGIQVTATSPTASAVRFETGVVELELSNRPHTETDTEEEEVNPSGGMRMFAKALIEFNLSLGTLVKNPVFIEAEPEFHEMAYFKTKIGLRNTVKDINDDLTEGKDTLLITLNRPTLFVQSSAADRAVLLWLSYNSSYDQWVEQWKTMAQDDNIEGVVTDAPTLPLIRNQEGADSTLFLQLTVQELGICIPILPSVQNLGVSSTRGDIDCHSALVLTLESSLISACYSNSLVTKGSFHTICLRFTEDFQMAMDDWRPSSYDHIMNSCVIPQGTYEVCSSANSNQAKDFQAAKDFHRVTIGQWRLNFKWRMEGIDVQFDPSIGHQLTALANTLTSLTGADDDIADLTSVTEQQEVSSTDVLSDQEVTPLKRPTSLKVDRNDEKRKSKAIMQEINEQAKVVSDLRTLGAKSGTIAEEADKLRQMETAVFKDFRRDIRKKLKAQGMKVSGRDKPTRRKSVKPQGNVPRSQKERQISYARQSTYPMTPYDSDYQPGLYNTPSSMKTPKNPRATLYPDPPSRVSFVLPLHTPSPTTPDASPMGWTDVRQAGMSRLGLGLDSGLTPLDLNATIGDPTQIREEIRQNRKSIRRRLTLHSTPMSRDLDGSDTEEEEEEEEEEEKYNGHSGLDDMDGSLSSTLRNTTAPSVSRSSAARDHASSAASPARSVAPEPELQLHLDVSIFIDSGKLTLHCHRSGPPAGPNDHLIPDAMKQESRRPWNSTESSPSRKPGVKSQLSSASSSSTSGIKLKSGTLPSMLSSQGFALFNLPAVDVKVEYQSEPENKQDPTTDMAGTSMQSSPRQNHSTNEGGGGVEKKNGSRRGTLFCWARLLTPAEEIVVTTSLLDFLEQALETIPANIGMMLTSPSSENLDIGTSTNLEASANSLVSSSSLDYTTFPVDVVVYVCMDPSLVHLSCLPASKVECLLQLPCVEFAFSSRGGQQASGFSGDATGADRSGTDFQDARDDLSAAKLSFSRCRSRHLSGDEIREEANKADMSLSAVLSNFSLVIFHPYGGGQFRRDGGKLVEEMLSNMNVSAADAHDESTRLSSGNPRKDALSLEVTFVRVNVSRKRHKLRPTMTTDQTLLSGMDESRRLGESLRSDSTSVSSATISSSKSAATLNKFSIMCDVGSATFRYDMRRLTEVLAFPKAWYRKTIVQRLFFGEEEQEEEMSSPEDEATSTILSSDTSTDSEDSFTDLPPRRYQRKRTTNSAATSGAGTPSSTDPSASTTGAPSPTSPGSKGSRDKFPYNPPSPSLFSIYSQLPSPSSPTLSQPGIPLIGGSPPPRSSPDLRRMVTEKRLSKEETTSQSSEPSGSEHSHSQATSDPCSSSGSLASGGPSWKTVLLLAINFSKVDTHMNMSNVMGSTLWSTEDLRCQSHLTIDSTGHRIFKINTGLNNSSLEAKGGVIGGLLQVSKLSCTSSQIKIPGKEPHHDLQLQLDSLESRIDYMGSSSLLARLTCMDITCEDEWKFRANSDPKVKYHTVESVYANSNITWDTMQLMICRSTTPDMLRIAVRLEEFFTQQFASSRRMLSTWDPIATAASQLAAARRASMSTAPIDEIDSRAHQGSRTDSTEEPKEHQHWQSVFDFLIQTFHKAHKNQPRPEGMRLGGQVTLQGRQALLACFHGLNFRSNSWALFTMREPKVEFETEALQVPSSEHCGEDTLVLQDLLFSLGHNQTQREQGWLATILRVSKNDKSHFPFTGPMLEAFQYVSSISTPEEFEQYFQYGDLPSQRRGTLRHEADPIFALPKLQLEMKSKQLQKLKLQKLGSPSPPSPEVQVTFVTHFTDHINVSMDFELILFLHDMVLAYINYKQKVMAPMKPLASNPPDISQLPSSTEKKLASLKSTTLPSSSQRSSPSTLSSSSSSPSPSSTMSMDVIDGKKKKEDKKAGQGNLAKDKNSDCRLFVCATWQLEPTIRLLSWGGKQIEPVGVDYILQKLGFRHARTTIPKWIQRGAMDPADKLLSLLAKHLLMIIMEREKSDAEKRQKDKALASKTSSKQGFPRA